MVSSNSEDENFNKIEELPISSTEEEKELNKTLNAEISSQLLDLLEKEDALDTLKDFLRESTLSISTPKNEMISMEEIIPTAKIIPAAEIFPAVAPTKETLSEKQEKTRSQLANFLLYILAGTLISSLALILSLIYISTNVDEKKAETFDKTSALVKDLITFVITSQVGLIGTALGFYFGSKNNSD